VQEKVQLETGANVLPHFFKDNTDRNRTSPFAFTGNKFEFRMVGSADSISMPNTVLNAIVAESFCDAADAIEAGKPVDDVIADFMREHRRIVFNGNGYSDEWVKEAEKRGLPNIRSMVAATESLVTDKAVALFKKFGIMSKTELELRAEVLYETYTKVINVEAQTMIKMAQKEILPAVIGYATDVAASINEIAAAADEADISAEKETLIDVSALISETKKALKALISVKAKAETITDAKSQAEFYRDSVKAAMDALRKPVDELELIVDKNAWPIPTYGDLLF